MCDSLSPARDDRKRAITRRVIADHRRYQPITPVIGVAPPVRPPQRLFPSRALTVSHLAHSTLSRRAITSRADTGRPGTCAMRQPLAASSTSNDEHTSRAIKERLFQGICTLVIVASARKKVAEHDDHAAVRMQLGGTDSGDGTAGRRR